MRKLTHQEIVHRQDLKKKQKRLLITVVLNNVRSLYNVGSIFRTSDAVGVEKIWICGITGHPPNNQIAKTALGAQDTVLWEHSKDVMTVLTKLKDDGYQLVLLEQMKESVAFQEFVPRFPVALIVGNEIDGVSSEVISLCDAAVEIEMVGLKNSLNVSVAFGIAAYHLRNSFIKVSLRTK